MTIIARREELSFRAATDQRAFRNCSPLTRRGAAFGVAAAPGIRLTEYLQLCYQIAVDETATDLIHWDAPLRWMWGSHALGRWSW